METGMRKLLDERIKFCKLKEWRHFMSEAANSKKKILSGTIPSEFEIIEFSVGEANYGVNVAKVREVINPVPVTQLPNSHPYIDGIFTLRGQMIPLVNLSCCLGVEDQEFSTQNIIVSEIHHYLIGFLVKEVSRIHRVSCSILEPKPHIANSESVVGIIKMGAKIVILLDFEKIIAEFNSQIGVKSTNHPQNSDVLQNVPTW
jgi:two-component system chemotaxis response regulator CheV